MVMGCIIIQGLTKKSYFGLQSRRKTSFYVHIVYLLLHGCGLHCIVRTISKTKRVNKKLYNYALYTRKKTSLLANIFGATVSEFCFFMKIKNIM